VLVGQSSQQLNGEDLGAHNMCHVVVAEGSVIYIWGDVRVQAWEGGDTGISTPSSHSIRNGRQSLIIMIILHSSQKVEIFVF
jgi:hypothetical protein